jgi:hypothetical protein
MELWELIARESIRDLVARHNANGDSGRFAEMLKVFADDASMELLATDGTVRRYDGIDRVATIFTDTKATWDASASNAGGGGNGSGSTTRHHIRHFTSTHQIDLIDESHAVGRCYFLVVMPHGVDHWGRYIDEYGLREGRWVIALRRALSDGRVDRSPTG